MEPHCTTHLFPTATFNAVSCMATGVNLATTISDSQQCQAMPDSCKHAWHLMAVVSVVSLPLASSAPSRG